ncbi:Na/Pi symporter [Corynebacterium sp. H127]|uniref:Na/Pi symporter n=1 Tax=Corynebacterium sp. H127 TaxID=3133418 RepID=UPI0030A49BE9
MATQLPAVVQKLHLPGTVHYINPRLIPHEEDELLISGFGRMVRWFGVACCIFALIIAINLVTDGVQALGISVMSDLVARATNPLLAVLIGVLSTFIVQSSTIVTTVTVAAVGSGLVPLDLAVMLIMGANLGTCFTAQLVSFGLFRRKQNFTPAIAAAMTHWWFNFFSIFAFFFIELLFHPLTRVSAWLTDALLGSPDAPIPTTGLVAQVVRPIVRAIGVEGLIGRLATPALAATACILLGILAITLAVQLTTILFSDIMAASSRIMLENSARRENNVISIKNFLVGLGLTLMTHSSSATVCSVVPIAGTRSISLRSAFSIILGANLGTTLTAVLSVFALSGDFSAVAMQAALIHVLFNATGVATVFLVRPVGSAIISLSEFSAAQSAKAPALALLAIIASYTLVPALFIAADALR